MKKLLVGLACILSIGYMAAQNVAQNKKLKLDPTKEISLYKDFKGETKILGTRYGNDIYCKGTDGLWYPVISIEDIDRAGFTKLLEQYNVDHGSYRGKKDNIIAWNFPSAEDFGYYDDNGYSIKRNGKWGVRKGNNHWGDDNTACTWPGSLQAYFVGTLVNNGEDKEIWGLYAYGKYILPREYYVNYSHRTLGPTGLARFHNDKEQYVVDLWKKYDDYDAPPMTPPLPPDAEIYFFSSDYYGSNIRENDVYFIVEKDGECTIYDRHCREKSKFKYNDCSKLRFRYVEQLFYDNEGNEFPVDPKMVAKPGMEVVENSNAYNIMAGGVNSMKFYLEVGIKNLKGRTVYMEATLCNANGTQFTSPQGHRYSYSDSYYISMADEMAVSVQYVPNLTFGLKKRVTRKLMLKYRFYYKDRNGKEVELGIVKKPFTVSK